MRPAQLLATIASFAALTQAWPWPESSGNKHVMLNKREDSSSNSAARTTAATEKTTDTATNTNSRSGTRTTGSRTASGSGSSAATSGSGNSDSGNATVTAAPSSNHTIFDTRDGPGSAVMITPGIFAPTTYYKAGDFITWAWNYTSIQGTPTAVDLWAYCSAAKATYTLATNMTFDDRGGKYIWDTNQYQATATQLLTNQYTLSIADADIGPSGSSGAGYLDPLPIMTFGMYTPQPYTPFADYVCATCNSGAMSLSEKQTWKFLFGMMSVTVLSFTWFATGRFGVL